MYDCTSTFLLSVLGFLTPSKPVNHPASGSEAAYPAPQPNYTLELQNNDRTIKQIAKSGFQMPYLYKSKAYKQNVCVCSETEHIILFHGIQFKEHLVIIVAAVHDKNRFSKHGAASFHSGEGDVVNRSKVLFVGGMNFRKDTDWMVIMSKYGGFGHMISFL